MRRIQAAEVYPSKHNLENRLAAIRQSDISPEAKQSLLDFVTKCAADGLSVHRQLFYATLLGLIAPRLGRAFLKPTRRDIERLLAEIEGRNLQEWTKINYRTAIKRFYKWLLGGDEQYPPEVRWIKTRRGGVRNKVTHDLLTREEIESLVKACRNARDRALIALLADSGCRIGELLQLTIGGVDFDKYGMVLLVSGKTGERRVRVVGDSIAYVAAWLETHPASRDRRAPLFVGMDVQTNRRAMTYAQTRKALYAATARAGLKKRVHPHLFRHTRATELASKVPEAPLEAQMGWVAGSAMSKVYVHLSGRDVDAAILRASGVKMDEEMDKKPELQVCPRCNVSNASVMKFCRRCGLPLEVEIALAMEDSRQIETDVNPALEVMRQEVLRLQRDIERLARSKGGPGKPSAPRA